MEQQAVRRPWMKRYAGWLFLAGLLMVGSCGVIRGLGKPFRLQVAIWAALAIAVAVTVYECATSPRKSTLRAPLQPRFPRLRTLVVVLLALTAGFGALVEANSRAWLFPVLSSAVIVWCAMEASKVTFRLVVVAALLAAVVALGALGAQVEEASALETTAKARARVVAEAATLDRDIRSEQRLRLVEVCGPNVDGQAEGDDEACQAAFAPDWPSGAISITGPEVSETSIAVVGDDERQLALVDELAQLRTRAAGIDRTGLRGALDDDAAGGEDRSSTALAKERLEEIADDLELAEEEYECPAEAALACAAWSAELASVRSDLDAADWSETWGRLRALVSERETVSGFGSSIQDLEDLVAQHPHAARRALGQALVDLRAANVELRQLIDDDAQLDVGAAETEAKNVPDDQDDALAQAAFDEATVERARTEAALKDAEERRTSAQANYDELPAAPIDVPVHELVGSGIDRVVTSLVGPFGVDDINPILGIFGYLALALALAIAYRYLEILNNQQYGAPIVVTKVEGASGDRQAELTQRMKERIRHSGVRGPGVTPGSTTASELEKLLKDSDEVPHGKTLGQLVRLIQTSAFPPAGVSVGTAITPRGSSKGAPYDASIEIATQVNGRFVASTILQAPTEPEVIDQAADFVATNSLDFSRSTPPWAKFQDSSGVAMREFRSIQAKASRCSLDADERIEALEELESTSPATAPVRMALAHEHDLRIGLARWEELQASAALPAARHRSGVAKARIDAVRYDHLAALRIHLETALDYPTLPGSRYRLATSLMMVARSEQVGLLVTWSERDALLALLRRRYPRTTWRRFADAAGQPPLGGREAEDLTEVVGKIAEHHETWRKQVDLQEARLAAIGPRASRTRTAAEVRLWQLEQQDPLDESSLRFDRERFEAARRAMLDLARRELQALGRQHCFMRLLWRSLQPRERVFWFRFLRDATVRRAAATTYESVLKGAEVKVAVLDGSWHRIGRLHADLQRIGSFEATTPSNAHYNVACSLADLSSHPSACGELEGGATKLRAEAMEHLRQALRVGGPQRFSPMWLRADPELAPLREDRPPSATAGGMRPEWEELLAWYDPED